MLAVVLPLIAVLALYWAVRQFVRLLRVDGQWRRVNEKLSRKEKEEALFTLVVSGAVVAWYARLGLVWVEAHAVLVWTIVVAVFFGVLLLVALAWRDKNPKKSPAPPELSAKEWLKYCADKHLLP